MNQVLRDLQETKVLTENKEIPEPMALQDYQAPQETRFVLSSVKIKLHLDTYYPSYLGRVNQAMMDRMEALGQKVIKVMKA